MGLTEELEHPSLPELFEKLPDYLVKMREENTNVSYMKAFKGWSSWASCHSVKCLPANPLSFTLYLLHNVQMNKSFATIKNIYFGVKFIHKGATLLSY